MENITSFKHSGMKWLNEPTDSATVDSCSEETVRPSGAYTISEDGLVFTLEPPAFKDFWSRTFYNPLLIKKDATALLCEIPNNIEASIAIDFEYTPCSQFDQAGILIHIDDDHWVKCGIEFCDGGPKLSCVVCNSYSDWSTQPWESFSARLQIHKVLQSSTVVIEAAPLGSEDFHFIRIAHISSHSTHRGEHTVEGTDTELNWKVGPFAACPTQNRGCVAKFTNFSIGPKIESSHNADLGCHGLC